MDALSAVLRDLRLESAGYRRFELAAPWSIAFSQAELRGIHIVIEGRCELVVHNDEVVPLTAGDLVLLPRADTHLLRSVGRRTRPVDSFELVAQTREGEIRHGRTGEPARILCGAFIFHDTDASMLDALPHLIRIGGAATLPWLASYIDVLIAESKSEAAGSEVVMARISDALIARALRHHAESDESRGWVRGLRDPQIARALGAMHTDLGYDWSLPALAQQSGMSRASFAARFADTVGTPPMLYLTDLRMRRATRLLVRDAAPLARVAEAVGYGSEAAFSAAFKRHTGTTPGSYRRQNREVARPRGVEPLSAP